MKRFIGLLGVVALLAGCEPPDTSQPKFYDGEMVQVKINHRCAIITGVNVAGDLVWIRMNTMDEHVVQPFELEPVKKDCRQ